MLPLLVLLQAGVAAGVPTTTVVRWGFFPTHAAIRLAVLEPPPQAVRWAAQLHDGGAAAPSPLPPLAQHGGAMATISPVGVVWQLDANTVQDCGNYSLWLQLFDSANSTLFAFTDSFSRSRRPWEGLGLGRDDILIPPFTAIKVQHTTGAVQVQVVGRTYGLTPAGLWSQVAIAPPVSPPRAGPNPAPVEILAAPMSLVAVDAAGVEYAAIAPRIPTVVHATATSANLSASWNAGPVSGTTTAVYDYDGCVKLTLTIEPTSHPVTHLTIRVPLKNAEAPLYNTVTDWLRIHHSGTLPRGEGEVYNTSATPRFALPGPFVPYIWLGSAPNGIAVFGDNDNDWLSAEPAYSVVRNASILTLEVHLITRPRGIVLTRRREIVLGMMASPAKPQPTEPVSSPRAWWPDDAGARRSPETVSAGLVAASIYWGTASDYTGYYPFAHNYSIFHALASMRGTGQYDVPNFFSSWVQLFVKDCAQHRAKCPSCPNASSCHQDPTGNWLNRFGSVADAFVRVQWAYTAAATSSHYHVYPYTNPQSILWDEDTEQFMDEWTAYDLADPRWVKPLESSTSVYGAPDGGFRRGTTLAQTRGNASQGVWLESDYYRDPVSSYVDMILYYQRKMLTWADGVYLPSPSNTSTHLPVQSVFNLDWDLPYE